MKEGYFSGVEQWIEKLSVAVVSMLMGAFAGVGIISIYGGCFP